MSHPVETTDDRGQRWIMRWGVADLHDALMETFGVDFADLTGADETRIFTAPLGGETVALHLYVDADETTRYAVGEISPGVHAIGRDR